MYQVLNFLTKKRYFLTALITERSVISRFPTYYRTCYNYRYETIYALFSIFFKLKKRLNVLGGVDNIYDMNLCFPNKDLRREGIWIFWIVERFW
ncbi:hypothetical protein BpHYR1_028238 [Brachionus plicatilis]|uniref:Uncharacterized protein n=1 Tax=Brachionus plicatilis TaxID=10195 RepID=A0A3M7R6N1_BRAPC|nr:hypothetical protein BpHYR1_028238 [Brachionus plicatilis]